MLLILEMIKKKKLIDSQALTEICFSWGIYGVLQEIKMESELY